MGRITSMMRPAIAVLLCLLAHGSGAGEATPDQVMPDQVTPDQVTQWIAAHATPLSTVALTEDFSDLAPLRDLIGDARVVGFGEAMHNTHELWSFRNRLLAYVVQELGFTAVALETGYLDSLVADDYIQGHNVDRDSAARSVFSWSRSVYAENVELVDWLRRYNAKRAPEQRVRLYGLEILTCGEFDGSKLVEAALAYVERLDHEAGARLRRDSVPLLPLFNETSHAAATDSQRAALLSVVQDLVNLYERRQVEWIKRTSSLAYERSYRQAVVARQLLAYLRAGGEGRDVADAQNLRWILEREGPPGRVFVFAHNGHLTKRAPLAKVRHAVRSPMGELLRDYLGDDLVVIGSLFDQGTARELWSLFGPVNSTYAVPLSAPDSLNAIFAKARPAPFLLDLRKLRGSQDVDAWFARPAKVRHVTGYDAYDIRASFDALLFVGKVSPQGLVREVAPVTRGCEAQPSSGERDR